MRPEAESTEANGRKSAKGDVVLLTGSSGCLGFQTLKLLVSKDEETREIRCLDLCEPSEEMRAEIEAEVEQCDKKKRIRYFTGDIRDANLVESLLCDLKVSCIIHCASKVDIWIENGEQDREELESINVGGTEILLQSCIRFAVSKFIHVSSYETFSSYHTIYYATENTIPEPNFLLFGASAKTKRLAEAKVKQYANNKLRPYKEPARTIDCTNDFLNAVIIRCTPIYGEHDKYFVTRYLKIAKFLSGKLPRFSNIWIRQQPIYVGNAAWALICAKKKMDCDESISGEDFHITDDTQIGDPFDFLEPFLNCKDMRLSKTTWPGLLVWLLIYIFFWISKIMSSLDVFNLFTKRRGRLEEAKERDNLLAKGDQQDLACAKSSEPRPRHWYQLITPQSFFFTINSLFLNRTKASLRLNYEPLFNREESESRAITWYRDRLELD